MNMTEHTEQTVIISDLTKEQLQAFLSGEMTWKEAHALAPGADITIIEVEPEDSDGEEE